MKDGLELVEKEKIEYRNPPHHELRNETPEALDRLHADDPAWTHVVCRCEKISEAEIIEAVRKGHTTLDGVKFYTRAGMGRCQSGFCSPRVMEILASELHADLGEITKCGGNSRMTAGRTRETDDENI